MSDLDLFLVLRARVFKHDIKLGVFSCNDVSLNTLNKYCVPIFLEFLLINNNCSCNQLKICFSEDMCQVGVTGSCKQ